MMVVEEGIVEDIQGNNEIKKFKLMGYIYGLSDDYGIDESMAQDVVLAWIEALGATADSINLEKKERKKTDEDATDVDEIGANSVVDYSNSSIEDVESNGRIIKLSGEDTSKIVPNVQLDATLYMVKASGAPTVKYYDANKDLLRVITAMESYEECMFDASSADVSRPGIIEISDTDGNRSLEMIPV